MKLKLSVISLTCLTSAALSAQKQNHPNVIFILADDLGWTDLGCYGSKFYETPNIDQLSKEGIRFTNAYAACPVSSPTRASFQTGKYPARIGITDWIKGRYDGQKAIKDMQTVCPVLPPENLFNLPLSEKTIAEVLKDNGYQTAHIGKWHLSENPLLYPQYQGYDINIGGCSKGSPGNGGYFTPYNNPELEDGPAGEYLTDRLGDECVKIMQKFKDKPFFINFPFYQVHTPLIGKPDKVKYFTEKAHRMGIDTIKNVFNEKPEWEAKQPFNEKGFRERMVQNNPVYAAMISSMDENIGKIIAELKRLNLYENTIIIFTSDNGGLSTAESSPTCNYPLKTGKGHIYEGGIREPLIASWTNHFPKNKVSDNLVSSVDYFPTILDLLQIPLPKKLKIDGKSVKTSFEGNKQDRGSLYWHYPHYSNQGGRPAGAIRVGDFKLIEFFDNGDLELYNLKKDIGETHNLTTSNKTKTTELVKELHAWRASVKAKMPTINKNYKK
jgi:arylsulfatase A-like enzyme